MNHRGDGKFTMIHREMRRLQFIAHRWKICNDSVDIICIIFNESGQKLKNLPGFLKKFTIIH